MSYSVLVSIIDACQSVYWYVYWYSLLSLATYKGTKNIANNEHMLSVTSYPVANKDNSAVICGKGSHAKGDVTKRRGPQLCHAPFFHSERRYHLEIEDLKRHIQQLRQIRYIMVKDCRTMSRLNISAHLHNTLKLNNY